MQSGSVNLIRKGDEAKFIGPSTPGQYFDPFIVRLLRSIAACLGAPYELMFGDLGAANYSSIRAGWQTYRKTISTWQAVLLPALDAYWMHVIQWAWLDGKLGKVGLKIPFEESPRDWARVTWTPPKFGYIDPTKEFPAAKVGIEIGVLSRTMFAAEAGVDINDVTKQLAAEKAAREAAGLTDATNSADPNASTDSAADGNAEQASETDAQDTTKTEEVVTK